MDSTRDYWFHPWLLIYTDLCNLFNQRLLIHFETTDSIFDYWSKLIYVIYWATNSTRDYRFNLGLLVPFLTIDLNWSNWSTDLKFNLTQLIQLGKLFFNQTIRWILTGSWLCYRSDHNGSEELATSKYTWKLFLNHKKQVKQYYNGIYV